MIYDGQNLQDNFEGGDIKGYLGLSYRMYQSNYNLQVQGYVD